MKSTIVIPQDISTPFYVFDSIIFNSLYSMFSNIGDVYYPVKSNNHPIILREVDGCGGKFEIDNINHLNSLLKLGINPKKIQFGKPIKQDKEISFAIESGVTRFVVDSFDEFKKIAHHGKNLDILIRLNIGYLLPVEDLLLYKWGTSIDESLKLMRHIGNSSHNFIGINFHVPEEYYRKDNIDSIIDHIASNYRGVNMEVLGIGGGLDNANTQNFNDKIVQLKNELGVKHIIVEPGRNLLNPCIDMVASVIAVHQRNSINWIHFNVGIYSGLLDIALKKKRHEIIPLNPSPQNKGEISYMVSGPTSDHIDVLGYYTFDQAINCDDHMLIKGCGAYSSTLRTDFDYYSTALLIRKEDLLN